MLNNNGTNFNIMTQPEFGNVQFGYYIIIIDVFISRVSYSRKYYCDEPITRNEPALTT